jgi:hypothetical protein
MSTAYIIRAPGLDGALAASVRASSGLAGGLSFDGYTGGQRLTASTGVNGRPGASPFTYWVRLMVGGRTGVSSYIFSHTLTDAAQGSADNIYVLFGSAGQIQCVLNTSLGNVTMTSAAGTQANYVGKVIDLCVTRSGTTLILYVNGSVLLSTTTANAAGAMNPDVLKIGASNTGTIVPNDMVVFRAAYFNRSLDESEVSILTATGVQVADQSASMASLSSGSLVIGNRYRITAAGGTFTGVGAANNDVGTEFIATGTTPTWGTGTLISIGAILAFDFETGIGFQLHDRFQNAMHGALAGSPTPRWTMPRRRGVLYATGTFSSGVAQRLTPASISGLTADALPAGALIEEVVVNVTSGTPTTVSLGTLSTATTDIVNAQTVAAGRNVETMASRFQASGTAQLWATFNAAATATFTIPYTLTQ